MAVGRTVVFADVGVKASVLPSVLCWPSAGAVSPWLGRKEGVALLGQ